MSCSRTRPTSCRGPYRGTPLMIDGVVYMSTGLGQVAALDPATGETLWRHDPRDWEVDQRRGLIQIRGIEFWTDGRAERILVATRGGRLVSIDTKTGRPDPEFGEEGRRRPDAGPPAGAREPEHELDGARDRRGRHDRDRRHGLRLPAPQQQSAWGRARFRRPHRQAEVDVPRRAAGGRALHRDLGERVLAEDGQHERVVDDERRPGTRLRLPAVRDADQRLLRRRPARRQRLRRVDRLSRRPQRRGRLALPDHPPRRLGLRPGVGPEPDRHHGRRQGHQGGGGGFEGRDDLRLRPGDRRTSVADRRDAGRLSLPGSGREALAHAAVHHPAAAVRDPRHRLRRPDRLHAGVAGGGAQGDPRLRDRPGLHAADHPRRGRQARLRPEPGARRRRELDRRLLRSGDEHPLRALADAARRPSRSRRPTRRGPTGVTRSTAGPRRRSRACPCSSRPTGGSPRST